MKRINVSVIEDIDLTFRKFASQKYKFERGWYSKAVVEAMETWILQNEFENKDSNNLFDTGIEIWDKIKEIKKVDENDISAIMDSITTYFSQNFSYADEINYKIENGIIEIFPINTRRENVVRLISTFNGYVIFNCPILVTIKAALNDMIDKKYKVISSEFKPIKKYNYANQGV